GIDAQATAYLSIAPASHPQPLAGRASDGVSFRRSRVSSSTVSRTRKRRRIFPSLARPANTVIYQSVLIIRANSLQLSADSRSSERTGEPAPPTGRYVVRTFFFENTCMPQTPCAYCGLAACPAVPAAGS